MTTALYNLSAVKLTPAEEEILRLQYEIYLACEKRFADYRGEPVAPLSFDDWVRNAADMAKNIAKAYEALR